jgi:hypothetical protein
MLDFASPDVMRVQHDCVRLKTKCDVSGSSVYTTPGTGQQLQHGVLVCTDRLLDTKVLVSDVYDKAEDMPDGCSGAAKVGCGHLLLIPGYAWLRAVKSCWGGRASTEHEDMLSHQAALPLVMGQWQLCMQGTCGGDLC